MLYRPFFTFSQKAATFGASGKTAPTPTIAMARCAVFSMMTLLLYERAPGLLGESRMLVRHR
jgi:hypothetical protein